MRIAGVVALGALVSFLVAMCGLAGAALLGLVAQPGPHQGFEIAALAIGMAAVAIGAAVIFSIVLVVGGRRTAIGRTTIGLIICLIAVLAAPAILGAAMTDPSDLAAEDELHILMTFLTVMAVPGLLTILVQWWAIRRHLIRTSGN